MESKDIDWQEGMVFAIAIGDTVIKQLSELPYLYASCCRDGNKGNHSYEAAKVVIKDIRNPKPDESITPTTDKERMLVAAILSASRGEKLQFKRAGEWLDKIGMSIEPSGEYRKKPARLPEIPWEFIPDRFEAVTINENENVLFHGHRAYVEMSNLIKIDLDGVELPCTINRPAKL